MKSFLLILFTMLIFACDVTDTSNRSPEVFQQAGLSSTFNYLVFKEVGEQHTIETMVGGEHMNIQKIWVFKDQSYQVILTPLNEKAMLHITGDGLKITKKTDQQFDIKVIDYDAMIEISQTAHPETAEYKLLIKRLK